MHSFPDTDIDPRVAWVSISMHACDPVPIVMLELCYDCLPQITAGLLQLGIHAIKRFP